MKLNDFVAIHRESGYSIKKREDWHFLSRGMVNYSFPQLFEIPIDNKIVNFLKWRYLISVIKAESRIKNNYEYILKTDSYELDDFRKKTRTTIRKSLSTCSFKKPSLNDLLTVGLKINQQTLKLQNRSDKFLTEPKHWEKYITLFYNNIDTTIMGAYFEDKLIGYAMAYELEGKHYFHLQHIDRNYATYYPMSGLMYVIINQILKENGKIEISDGIESFDPMPTLNQFKTYMRFDRVPINRVYVIHPALLLVLRLVVFYYVHLLGKRKISNHWVRRIITLYQGHRVLSKMTSQKNLVETRACISA